MKVHEKNKDVYSSLITITQAAKTVVAPTFSPEGGGASYLQGTGITLTSAGNTIYYNLTTDGSTPDDPTISSTKYTEPIALSSGTNKIKAIAVDVYGNSSSVVSRTYKGIAPTTLPFNWVGTSSAGKDDLAGKTGVSINLPSDYATSNAPYRLKFDGTAKYVIIYTNEKPETVTFTAKLFETASTGSKMKVQASVDGTDYTDIEEFTIKGDANSTFDFTTSNPFNATHRVVKLALSSRDKNVAVGSISVSAAPVPVTITAAEYATYVNTTKPLDFSATGITVYTATDNETSVTLNEVATGKVPANTPVVLYKAGADGTPISVPVIASADAIGGTNDLRVSTGTDVANMYVLA
jgi:phage terminase large subunit-like protein